jgi:hypothetical protein
MGYKSVEKRDDADKAFVNKATLHVFKKTHKYMKKLPQCFVLDTEFWKSTTDGIPKRADVYCAQMDPLTFKKMKKSKPSKVQVLKHASALDLKTPPLDLDHLDFCGTWKTTRDMNGGTRGNCGAVGVLDTRFKNKLYNDGAVVRLTVSSRSSKKGSTVENTVSHMISDIVTSGTESGYNIEFVPVQKWGPDVARFHFQGENSALYCYGKPVMVNTIFIVHKSSSLYFFC